MICSVGLYIKGNAHSRRNMGGEQSRSRDDEALEHNLFDAFHSHFEKTVNGIFQQHQEMQSSHKNRHGAQISSWHGPHFYVYDFKSFFGIPPSSTKKTSTDPEYLKYLLKFQNKISKIIYDGLASKNISWDTLNSKFDIYLKQNEYSEYQYILTDFYFWSKYAFIVPFHPESTDSESKKEKATPKNILDPQTYFDFENLDAMCHNQTSRNFTDKTKQEMICDVDEYISTINQNIIQDKALKAQIAHIIHLRNHLDFIFKGDGNSGLRALRSDHDTKNFKKTKVYLEKEEMNSLWIKVDPTQDLTANLNVLRANVQNLRKSLCYKEAVIL